ncbi:MAG: hypothetical protein ABJN69_07485 [Hellea sp.]
MNEVWMCDVKGDYRIGDKLGLAHKFYEHDWQLGKHMQPALPDDVLQNMKRHNKGESLKRKEMPEASYVFCEKSFKKAKDLFPVAGFLVVRGLLAEILSGMDLGDGGLVPYTIYGADKETPLQDDFYLLNFGAQKDSFLPQESRKVDELLNLERDGIELWFNSYAGDKDIAVSEQALIGADLWYETRLSPIFFMSERLAHAIQKVKIKPDLRLNKCRVFEVGN